MATKEVSLIDGIELADTDILSVVSTKNGLGFGNLDSIVIGYQIRIDTARDGANHFIFTLDELIHIVEKAKEHKLLQLITGE